MTYRTAQRNDTALDFVVADHGSIVLLRPYTPAAEAWARENLPGDTPMHGKAFAIERRYFRDIFEGIRQDGLVIA